MLFTPIKLYKMVTSTRPLFLFPEEKKLNPKKAWKKEKIHSLPFFYLPKFMAGDS